MADSVLSPVSLTSYYDPYDGSVLQAKLYFYKAGTQDPVTVHTDPSLGIPHAQPVLSGGSGRVPPVWIGFPAPYRVRTFDQYDVLLEDIDNLPGATGTIDPEDPDPPPVTGGELPPAGSPLDLLLKKGTMKTGDMFPAFTNALGLGDRAVRANGQSIGDALSGATERANADCHDLFVFLWGQDGTTDATKMLTISDGTTGSAQGDWDAHKRLTLPDLRGRTVVGTDKMGNPSSSGRLTNGLSGVNGAVDNPGAYGGLAYHTLTGSEMPVHAHTINDPGHAHGISDPGHDHGLGDPWHAHTFSGTTDGGDSSHTHSGISSANIAQAGSGGVSANWATGGTGGRFAGLANSPYHAHAYSGTTAGSATGQAVWGKVTGITGTAAAGVGTWASNAGGGALHNNLQPYLSLTWYVHL